MNAIHSTRRQPSSQGSADDAPLLVPSLTAAGPNSYPSRVVLTPDATHAGGGAPLVSAGNPPSAVERLNATGHDRRGEVVLRKTRDAGELVKRPHNPSDLARALRIYGGPSLETQRDDAQTMMWLSGGLAIVAGHFASVLAGEGVPIIPLVATGLCFFALMMFAEAVSRRNRVQRRLDDVDAKVTAALTAALVVEVSDLVGAG